MCRVEYVPAFASDSGVTITCRVHRPLRRAGGFRGLGGAGSATQHSCFPDGLGFSEDFQGCCSPLSSVWLACLASPCSPECIEDSLGSGTQGG